MSARLSVSVQQPLSTDMNHAMFHSAENFHCTPWCLWARSYSMCEDMTMKWCVKIVTTIEGDVGRRISSYIHHTAQTCSENRLFSQVGHSHKMFAATFPANGLEIECVLRP
jgi:hypothetical protein